VIGEAYRSVSVQAVLGPDRSLLVPAVLWVGWLDGDGSLIAMAGTSVSADAWGPTDDGVANLSLIDGGLAGDGWTIAAVGLFDAAADGALVIAAELATPITPDEGTPLSIFAGSLTVNA